MGDAGPPVLALGDSEGPQRREVTVLVTGFGPFKTFVQNPSHLITTQLPPAILDAAATTTTTTTTSPSSTLPQPTLIRLQTLPQSLRVSYPTVAATIPTLLRPTSLTQSSPDYVLHLGMAAGRRHYALETLAHRDGYTIKDVDNVDGVDVGSRRWAKEGCPSVLEAGWDRIDVLGRWREELQHDAAGAGAGAGEGGLETAVRAVASIPDVRLSNDAGRFLCDFVFYESLSERWKENRLLSEPQPPYSEISDLTVPKIAGEERRLHSREGKVAFLHVPGDTDQAAIDRGVRVTLAAIRALVSSWEDGFRREGRVVVSRKFGVEFIS